MAITKHFVRVPQAQADALSQSSERIEALASFRLAPSADYTDLDWASSGLVRLAGTTAPQIRTALLEALDGTSVLSGARPDLDIHSDVRGLNAAAVKRASDALAGFDVSGVIAAIPEDAAGVEKFLGVSEAPVNPRDYFRRHLEHLLTFVRDASVRDLAIVNWWQ